MAATRSVRLKGLGRCILQPEESQAFDKGSRSEPARLSVCVDNIGATHIFGFTAEDLVSGRLEIAKAGAAAGEYAVEIDAVVPVSALRPKDWVMVDAGKARCVFHDVGYGDEWYLGAKFQGDRIMEIEPILPAAKSGGRPASAKKPKGK